MNEKQRKNRLKYLQQPSSETEQIREEKIIFPYTEQYIMKRQMMKVVAPLFFGALLVTCVYISSEFFPQGWFYDVLSVISFVFCIIGMIGYGGLGRVYGKDIYIKNNRIYFEVHLKTNYGRSGNRYVFKTIKRVKVKQFKIVIYGYLWDEIDVKKPPFQKLAFPMEIENVDEFIRFAQSQVVKE